MVALLCPLPQEEGNVPHVMTGEKDNKENRQSLATRPALIEPISIMVPAK